MSEIMENELVSVAMQIILKAGDARLKLEKALKYSREFDFEQADAYIIGAEEDIRLAHVSQTGVIQNETRGKSYDLCLLFTHAQDTLMTINSEVRLSKEIIEMMRVVESKLK